MEKFEPNLAGDSVELRAETAEQVMTFLTKSGMLEYLSDPEKKEEFFHEKLTPGIAEEYLKRLNGIINGVPISERTIYKESRGVADEKGNLLYHPPSPASQQKCLEMTVEAVKNLSLHEAAELVALNINLLHMFPDGNGRLARLVYMLMQPDTRVVSTEEGQAMIEKYLTEREGSVNFDPSLISEDLNSIIMRKTKDTTGVSSLIVGAEAVTPNIEAVGSNNLSEKTRALYGYFLETDTFDAVCGLREYVFNTPNPLKYLLRKSVQGHDFFTIDTEKVISEIQEEKQFWSLMGRYDKAKVDRLTSAIDMYVNPDKYPSRVPGVNLRDYLLAKVSEKAEMG